MKSGPLRLILLFAIVIAAAYFMWQAAGVKSTPKPMDSAAATAAATPTPTPTPTQPTLPLPGSGNQPPAAGLPNTAPGADGLREEFSEKLNDILTNTESTDQAALQLLALIPQCNVEEQVEASRHAVNLLNDTEFNKGSQYILNPATPRDVMDVWYGDSLNRPTEVYLPLLVEVAEKPGHPLQEEVTNILDVILGPEYTENHAALRQLAQKYLAEQAAENPPADAPPAAPAPAPASPTPAPTQQQ